MSSSTLSSFRSSGFRNRCTSVRPCRGHRRLDYLQRRSSPDVSPCSFPRSPMPRPICRGRFSCGRPRIQAANRSRNQFSSVNSRLNCECFWISRNFSQTVASGTVSDSSSKNFFHAYRVRPYRSPQKLSCNSSTKCWNRSLIGITLAMGCRSPFGIGFACQAKPTYTLSLFTQATLRHLSSLANIGRGKVTAVRGDAACALVFAAGPRVPPPACAGSQLPNRRLLAEAMMRLRPGTAS